MLHGWSKTLPGFIRRPKCPLKLNTSEKIIVLLERGASWTCQPCMALPKLPTLLTYAAICRWPPKASFHGDQRTPKITEKCRTLVVVMKLLLNRLLKHYSYLPLGKKIQLMLRRMNRMFNFSCMSPSLTQVPIQLVYIRMPQYLACYIRRSYELNEVRLIPASWKIVNSQLIQYLSQQYFSFHMHGICNMKKFLSPTYA